jgi:hypothetical protein
MFIHLLFVVCLTFIALSLRKIVCTFLCDFKFYRVGRVAVFVSGLRGSKNQAEDLTNRIQITGILFYSPLAEGGASESDKH